MAEESVVDAIVALARSAPSQEHFKAINNELLTLLRGGSASARAMAVKTERGLSAALREEWLTQLPQMLPIISELLEDDDEAVEVQTRKWVREVEEITGESMDSMLQ
jgi:U3 small nucleolar RNA-associated protein 10